MQTTPTRGPKYFVPSTTLLCSQQPYLHTSQPRGRAVQAFEALSLMGNAGVRPAATSCTLLVEACGRAGLAEQVCRRSPTLLLVHPYGLPV